MSITASASVQRRKFFFLQQRMQFQQICQPPGTSSWIQAEKTVKSFFSDLRGYQMTYGTEEETHYITVNAENPSKGSSNAQNTHDSVPGSSDSSSQKTVYLLTKGAQPMGLYPKLSAIILNGNGTLSYSLTIYKKDGTSITDTMTYYVRPVTR